LSLSGRTVRLLWMWPPGTLWGMVRPGKLTVMCILYVTCSFHTKFGIWSG
jgi:hypothetical protein